MPRVLKINKNNFVILKNPILSLCFFNDSINILKNIKSLYEEEIYLLGVKYSQETGGDIQFSITGHVNRKGFNEFIENNDQAMSRELAEELGLQVNCDIGKFKYRKNVNQDANENVKEQKEQKEQNKQNKQNKQNCIQKYQAYSIHANHCIPINNTNQLISQLLSSSSLTTIFKSIAPKVCAYIYGPKHTLEELVSQINYVIEDDDTIQEFAIIKLNDILDWLINFNSLRYVPNSIHDTNLLTNFDVWTCKFEKCSS